jgi:DNA-binding NtrC family response regulator
VSASVIIVEDPLSAGNCGWEWASLCPDWTVSRRTVWEAFSLEQLRSPSQSLLVANAVPGTERAIQFFRWLRQNPLPVATFAIVREEDRELLEAAVDAVDDFLLWPVRVEELRQRISRLLSGQNLQNLEEIKTSLTADIGLRQLVGQDPSFLKIVAQVVLYGANDAPVLLSGETGTGKEQCARVIHLLSNRRKGPFIPVDCGALPDHLFENEFFGHARGAYTDARYEQKGLIGLAENGTLFMDEIDNLAPSTQAKLLRVLQERTYRPLGAEQFKQANARIVAASNRDLEQLVRDKQFRADLFFRINVLRIQLPALRHRRADIGLLSRHFIDEICKAAGMPRKLLSLSAIRRLEAYNWPGNVRELYNAMQRAVLCSTGVHISASTLDVCLTRDETAETSQTFRNAKYLAIRQFEQQYVRSLLEKHHGNVTQAAREAGKDRRAFGRLAKKYRVYEQTA